MHFDDKYSPLNQVFSPFEEQQGHHVLIIYILVMTSQCRGMRDFIQWNILSHMPYAIHWFLCVATKCLSSACSIHSLIFMRIFKVSTNEMAALFCHILWITHVLNVAIPPLIGSGFLGGARMGGILYGSRFLAWSAHPYPLLEEDYYLHPPTPTPKLLWCWFLKFVD